MKSIKVFEYSRSRSFDDDLILQGKASGEISQDQWSSGCILLVFLCGCSFLIKIKLATVVGQIAKSSDFQFCCCESQPFCLIIFLTKEE